MSFSEPKVKIPAQYPRQYFLTDKEFPDITNLHHTMIDNPPRPQCLGNYWIAYIRSSKDSMSLINDQYFPQTVSWLWTVSSPSQSGCGT